MGVTFSYFSKEGKWEEGKIALTEYKKTIIEQTNPSR